jgi:small subunit ribosomal protein S1
MPEDSFAGLMKHAEEQGTTTGRRVQAGETLRVRVMQIAGDAIFVDCGTPGDGRIPRVELENAKGEITVKVGSYVDATVIDARPDGPRLSVGLGRRGNLDTSALELARASDTPVVGRVERAVKGGLEVTIGGLQAFCPASQVDLVYTADLSGYVGQELELVVLEIREGGRSVVVSRRALLEARRRQSASDLVARLVAGSDVEGTVRSLNRHGAIVDLGGLDGFVHLSELARHRVERAEDAVAVGDAVKARVLSVEATDKGPRVKLSIKALAATDASAAPAPDEVLRARVVSVAARGVHVTTPKGDGFIPLSELGLPPGADHRRAFPAGKELDVALVSNAGGRVRFSATQVARVEERRNFRDYAKDGAGPAAAAFGSLGDLLRPRLGLPDPPSPVEAEPTTGAPAVTTTTATASPVSAATPSTGTGLATSPAAAPPTTAGPPPPNAAPAKTTAAALSPTASPASGPAAPPARRDDPPGVVRRKKR